MFQDFFVDVSFPATLTRAMRSSSRSPSTTTWRRRRRSISASSRGAGTRSARRHAERCPSRRARCAASVPGDGEHGGRQLAPRSPRRAARAPTPWPAPCAWSRTASPSQRAQSGMLAPGSAEHALSFPRTAVPGSNQLYLEIYPAFLSQVVSGMDSMLQVPNGCFEQTTSTTWPNVLVTQYMKPDRPDHPGDPDEGRVADLGGLPATAHVRAPRRRLLVVRRAGRASVPVGHRVRASWSSPT